ncbi:MAG: PAS domain S-box protein [Ignavibacteriales bacterium]|nr:PAS domain S-box protein [Ignavibacteriales bacterium]
MQEIIEVLLIEENANDANLTKDYLAKINEISVSVSVVEYVEDVKDFLSKNSATIIFLAVNFQSSAGLDYIRKMIDIAPSLPIVVLTDSNANGFAVQSIKTGAQDYLLKDKMNSETIRRSMLYSIERKKNESALRESEKRFKELANLLPQVVFETDLNGIITFANDLAFQAFGYSQEDYSNGLPALEMIIPSERQIGAENIYRVLNSENSTSHEYTALRKDGTTFPVMIFSSPIVNVGKTIGLRGVIIDITQRKTSEEKLIKLSRAVEQSPASVIITDLNGNIEYVNPKFVSLTGFSLDEVKGKNPRILKSGFTINEEYANLWSTIKSGNEWKGEFHNKKKNGELYWEAASISPIIDNNGTIINYLAVKEDITERKRSEKELIIAKEKAEQADKLKSEFLAQMSHEIRTPLHAMLSFSRIIRDKIYGEESLNTDIDNSFEGIDISGKRIIRTIDLIVNISQLQTGSYDYKPQEVDLYNEILSKVYNEYLGIAKKSNLDFNLSKEECNTQILIDRYSVQQIIENLIDNAIRFTDKGFVNISLGMNNEKKLYIQISDTGIGMSKEYLQKIFTPFSQEEQGYTRPFDGNGLGLALIKKYCDLNNIALEVKSEKGVGTTFTLTFSK